jgi:hypothetical protein
MNQGDNINAGGRDLTITAASLTLGDINGGTLALGGGGAINLTATNGGISAGQVNSMFGGSSILATTGDGGPITLSATNGDITLSSINAISGLGGGDGGDVTVNVTQGSFSAQAIETTASGSFPSAAGFGGDVTINADNGIAIELIDTKSGAFGLDSGRGGTITLNGVVLNDSTVRDINTSDASGIDTGSPETNTGTGTTIIGDNGVIVNIGSTGSQINPVVNNVVNAVIQSLGEPLPGVSPELQQRPGETTLEWAARITQDVPRVTNSSTNRGLQALMNAQLVWDNVMEDIRVRDANKRAFQQQLDAEMLQWETENLLNQ